MRTTIPAPSLGVGVVNTIGPVSASVNAMADNRRVIVGAPSSFASNAQATVESGSASSASDQRAYECLQSHRSREATTARRSVSPAAVHILEPTVELGASPADDTIAVVGRKCAQKPTGPLAMRLRLNTTLGLS